MSKVVSETKKPTVKKGLGTTKKYDPIKASIISKLAENYSVTDSFVRQSVNDKKQSVTAKAIKVDYNRMYAEVKQVMESN